MVAKSAEEGDEPATIEGTTRCLREDSPARIVSVTTLLRDLLTGRGTAMPEKVITTRTEEEGGGEVILVREDMTEMGRGGEAVGEGDNTALRLSPAMVG